jgi:hypothetical protein
MHWVKATAPDGRPQYVNLASATSMMPVGDGTMIFLGGIAAVKDASGADRFQFALTSTRETPDELFALPRIAVNMVQAIAADASPAKKPRKKKQ